MALKDTLAQLNEIDFNDLDLENIGAWPPALKGIVLFLVFAAVIAAGYFLYLTPKLDELAQLENREQELREEFAKKARDSANLEALRRQRDEMEETFGDLLSQLPKDTEVPGLLEDITQMGLDAGLDFNVIDLRPEREQEFYVELPIAITVEGSYHDMGAFVSGVANLSRIVTLHGFRITPRRAGTDELSMQIEARTYRYKDGDG